MKISQENRRDCKQNHFSGFSIEYTDILAQIKILRKEISQIKRKRLNDRICEEKEKLIDNKKEELVARKIKILFNELEEISKKNQ